ncbi:hypothetical protein Pint_02261 [Pistacia integerrima]|uniref:Uncharacterized protein n=1 Tax=Pistacia integerrima TaxID=434235 RepID=A0ACC0ZQ70_9ROSI|nr:hypothetical protein Pint_02261 [Pistacia integerrima]
MEGLLPSGCVEKKVHQFYFIKFRPCEDQNVKYRIEEVKQLLKKINQEQLSINEELGTKQMRHRTNNLATERQLTRKIKETQQSEAVDSFSPVQEFSNMLKQRQVERYIKFELMLEKAHNEANNRYNRYVSVMSNAKELTEKKDVKGLKELSLREVDTFMSEWNRIKELRLNYNYKKSTLESLNNRELSWDGRMRNLNEEPIVLETQRYLKQSSCIDCRTRGWHCSGCIFNPIEQSRPKDNKKKSARNR